MVGDGIPGLRLTAFGYLGANGSSAGAGWGRTVTWRCTAPLILLIACLHSGKAQAGWVRYALVVGYNYSDDPGLKPLRYADDDAVKHAQLLSLTTNKPFFCGVGSSQSAAILQHGGTGPYSKECTYLSSKVAAVNGRRYS